MPVCAGLLLYLLDVAFRCAQQVQPVHVSKVAACKSATLATLHFDTDPFTPIKPVQVIFLPKDFQEADVCDVKGGLPLRHVSSGWGMCYALQKA